MCQRRKNGATPLDLATDDTCHDLLEHHATILATMTDDPATLMACILEHCATLSASEDRVVPSTPLTLRPYHLDPSFLWAPPAPRAAVIAWAQNAFIAQLAGSTQPFTDLLEDCACDVLEFFEMALTRTDALLIAEHCSSSEARAWVRAVIASAVVVGA
jgi:hypothetical protein